MNIKTTVNSIGLFDFGINKITIFGTIDEPWFIANEIAAIFDMKNIRKVLADYPENWKAAVT